MTNPEIQKIVETKIYPKYTQINKNQRDIPIWLKHCDKQTAEKLRTLCGSYRNNPQGFFYLFWLPRSYENYDKNTTSFHELKHFQDNFPEFLREL